MYGSFRFVVLSLLICHGRCRDEERIMKACFWPNEIYEPCFGGCAEVSCDNPRNHLRPCYPYCEPGCVCEDPYVRDDRTHQCVLPQNCSPTQMGIPVPTKRSEKPPSPKYQISPKYSPRSQTNPKREDLPAVEYSDNEMFPPASNKLEDLKRLSEVGRMGNYFNIVIAPPPIKALQPRKMLQGSSYRSPAKRV